MNGSRENKEVLIKFFSILWAEKEWRDGDFFYFLLWNLCGVLLLFVK